MLSESLLVTPHCTGMEELPAAAEERARLQADSSLASSSPLHIHLSQGLAYTSGSALGSIPPSQEACLSAFLIANKMGLTAGARAWSKHAHRSGGTSDPDSAEGEKKISQKSEGWWGIPSGPVVLLNERALTFFWKVMGSASWRNIHWLPHNVLLYEVRVEEGYGMRWSQDWGGLVDDDTEKLIEGKEVELAGRPWIFRGFVEPMMENGHEVGWRH